MQLASERMNNTKEQELSTARQVLWKIARKRLLESGVLTENSNLAHLVQKLLDQWQVPGVSLSIIQDNQLETLGVGYSSLDPKVKLPSDGSTWFEVCSLSKTIATAFALEVFRSKGFHRHSSQSNPQ